MLGGGAIAHAQTVQPPTKSVLYEDGQTDRYLLGGTWLYRADPGNVGLAAGYWQQNFSTTGWSPVTVPNSFNAGDFSTQSWLGSVGWYRRDFSLPSGAFPGYVPAAARHWLVRFESVNYYATVWLNGRQLGTHAGAFLPWELDLKGLRPGENQLVVRVDSRTTPAALPPGPGSNWFNFGGIQREVYLRAVARADIQRAQIRPLLPCPGCAATISEQATIRNVTGQTQTVQLRGSYGSQRLNFGKATLRAYGTWTPQATVRLAHPRLWSLGQPNLYKATLTLSDAKGRALGGYLDYSGIRSVTLTNGRLLLNGHPVDLRGVDLQEENVTTGGALSVAQIEQQLAWARQLGAGIIRTHYPVGALMEELADRAGILIWSEVPVWGVQNVYLSQPGWLSRAYSIVRQNILENQNHPSILLWSIANELPTPASGAESSYIKNAAALVRSLDPTRPVAMAVDNWPGVPCQPAYAPLDAIGLNEYFGLFQEGGGSTDDRDALSSYLDLFRSCYPQKAVFVTEFGFDGNRNGPVEEYGTYQFQSSMLAFHLGVLATKSWLSGAMIQTLQDFPAYPYYNGANPWPDSPFNQKGLVDLYGNPKPAFSVVSGIYHSFTQLGARARR